MRMSAAGRALLIQREGFRTKAYRDSVGVWTIGVGHTAAAGPPAPRPGMTITKQQVDELLSRDLRQYEEAVDRAVTVELTQGQFDALVSLCFNIGVGGFRNSTVVRRLNAGNYRGAADAFLMWNKPSEIMGRRRGERAQFIKATDTQSAGAAVKFMPSTELAEGEQVDVNYMRAAGSRVVTLADTVKKTAAGVGLSDVVATATQTKELVAQTGDVVQGIKSGAPPAEVLSSYAPLFIGLAASVIIILLVVIVWLAAHKIQRARTEDAVYDPVDGLTSEPRPPVYPAEWQEEGA